MSLRLLAVFAHPDDETLGMGGTLGRVTGEGAETYLLTATRGEKGWFGDPAEYPGPEELGRQREGELQAAAAALGIRETHFLDYVDGDLDQAQPSEVVASIATEIRRLKPQVVATFGHDGIYGHPDHIAICQLTTAAVMRAASSDASPPGEPHSVAKLYYMVTPKAHLDAYEAVFGELVMNIDGVERRSQGWPDWAIHLDGRVYCSNAVLGSRFVLRACIVNFRTEAEDVDALLDVAAELGAGPDAELRPASLRGTTR